jgi:hypothetical protein
MNGDQKNNKNTIQAIDIYEVIVLHLKHTLAE